MTGPPHNGSPMTPQGGRQIRVPLGRAGYTVLVEAGALDRLGSIVAGRAARGSRAFVVADDGLPRSDLRRATASLEAAGLRPTVAGVSPSEQNKTLASLQRLLVELTRSRHERGEPVIALGGGVVGDLAGFAAGVYRRGVPVVQCPTTLLAMVDASVGGKTGVNIDLGGAVGPEDLKKNMVGVFHQPDAVVADVSVLGSLSDREFRCGLAESVKHGMLSADRGDPGLLDWTESNLDRVLSREPSTLVELVARNVAVKAGVVGTDEREEADPSAGGRAILNLGHTFGHALEVHPGLSPDGDSRNAPLKHGEAVALGLVAACRAAELLDPAVRRTGFGDRVVGILGRAGLPVRVRGLDSGDRLLDSMGHDKKVSSGVLRLVLPAEPGRARVVEGPPLSVVLSALDAIRA